MVSRGWSAKGAKEGESRERGLTTDSADDTEGQPRRGFSLLSLEL